jgi:hypothetical protein
MKYICKCCDYSTEDKSNFNKHITSRKHKLVESKEIHSSSDPTILNAKCEFNEKIIVLNELVESVKVLNDCLEKQQNQINEHKLQIDNIISEIF